MQIQRVLIVHRKSLYQIYIQEHKERAVQQAIRRRDPAALALKQSHQAHNAAHAAIQRLLRRRGITFVSHWRTHVRSTRSFDLVISLGGDGTLLDTSHKVRGDTPLLGINSDPSQSIGALCCGFVQDLPRLLDELSSRQLRPVTVNRIRIRLDGREILGPVLNDALFAHTCPAGLTRFDRAIVDADASLRAHPARDPRPFQHYRSSGLWVSTAIGSTAGIRSAGGCVMGPRSRRLQFMVREPYVAPAETPRPREELQGVYLAPSGARLRLPAQALHAVGGWLSSTVHPDVRSAGRAGQPPRSPPPRAVPLV